MEVHGAVQWLIKAYEDYRNRVFNRQMSYKAFLEENLVKLSMPIILDESATYYDLQQEAIDRDKVKHILENRKFTETHFVTDIFEEADAIRMIGMYNVLGINTSSDVHEECLPLSSYPTKAKEELAKVFRDHKLLCPDISAQDLIYLLSTGMPSCKYMIPPYTRNRDFGLVLNILVSAGAMTRKWSSTICKSGMLLTSTGAKMQDKNLSAAMHWFDDYKTISLDEKQKAIERDVMKVLSNLPNVIRRLRK